MKMGSVCGRDVVFVDRNWGSLYYWAMIKKIVTLGAEVLGDVSQNVEKFDEELAQLVEDMFDTLEANPGVGLAGPQIGVLKRVFVVELDDKVRRVFINPQISAMSGNEIAYEEGCLSIPGIWFDVLRPESVTIYAYDEKGKPFHIDADGLLARVIQHEYDHLDGRLFIDRINGADHDRLVKKYEHKTLFAKRKKK